MAMNLNQRLAVLIPYLSIGVLVTSSSLSAQSDVVSVDESRPLAAAIRILEARYGWIITYEDPKYQFSGDLVVVTSLVRRSTGAPALRNIIPRGGPFSFSMQRPSATAAGSVVSDMVAAYNSTGFPGAFAVINTSGVLHVVPISVNGKTGSPIGQKSILDTAITLPAQRNRSVADAVNQALNAVQKKTAEPIEPGMFPVNRLRGTLMEEGATNEIVRQFLVRALNAAGGGASWQLFYAADLQKYVVNVHLVRTPTGGPMLPDRKSVATQAR